MAITKQYGKYYVECNNCGATASPFNTFPDALEWAKDKNWKIRSGGGEWWMECDECRD